MMSSPRLSFASLCDSLLLSSLLLLGVVSSCAPEKAAELEKLGLEGANVIQLLDNHSGLLGDGMTQIHFKLPRAPEADVLNRNHWSAAPIDEELRGWLLSDDGFLQSDHPLNRWPADTSRGYYYFFSKQREFDGGYSVREFLEKKTFSKNFIFCYLDTVSLEGWYFEVDT